jgi:hypothetical protein
MTEPILHFHKELSDLILALKEASNKMTPEDRFEGVKNVVTASADRLKNYKGQNPNFANHPILRATESAIELLSYDYEDAEAVSRAEHDANIKGGTPSVYLKPVIDYLIFVEQMTPL